jgi:3-(3-hydroxy-phenyl)propionate hydroxylase
MQLRTDLRWCSRVVGVDRGADAVTLDVDTPQGRCRVAARWVIAADGARSAMRGMLGLEAQGQVFHDRFLIADIRMRSHFPTERWFWFDPPFHPGQSVLLHRQADDVWRVDFQLGWDADPEEEKQPERIASRLRAMLGHDARFDLEWASVYTFSCRRMARFRHGRVLFAGDAAHVVSPFGARGGNSGIQDADNLAWKLDLVLRGLAPEALLDTYDAERIPAADENIRHSTRATDFITPKSAASRIFRNAVLELAKHHAFARRLVNSGRLSLPAVLRDSPLNTADREADWPPSCPGPGCAAVDAPVRGPRGEWLLAHLAGRFTLLLFGAIDAQAAAALAALPLACEVLCVQPGAATPALALQDPEGLLARRYGAQPGTA